MLSTTKLCKLLMLFHCILSVDPDSWSTDWLLKHFLQKPRHKQRYLPSLFRCSFNKTMVCVADHEGHGQGHEWVLERQPSGTADCASCQENPGQAERASCIAYPKHQILKPFTSCRPLLPWVKKQKEKKKTSSTHCVWLHHFGDIRFKVVRFSQPVSSCILEDSKWGRDNRITGLVFLCFICVRRIFQHLGFGCNYWQRSLVHCHLK